MFGLWKSADELGDVVQQIIDARNDMRRRVNAGKAIAKGERKAYYQSICKDLMVSVDGAFSKLSDLVKKA